MGLLENSISMGSVNYLFAVEYNFNSAKSINVNSGLNRLVHLEENGSQTGGLYISG
jgi:hypothetical protein